MMSDLELLEQYARENRQYAFAALLDRHLKLVYSAALRQVRSPELAEEVAQSVFADLARNASKLEPQTILTAWLYQVTRRTAIDVVRRESRRQLREQIALDMANMNSNSSDWTAIEPLLDEAMEELPPLDRTAILLRFFEDKSLREVGQAMGTSEDAAQKRVTRALDLLRASFSKRGRTVGLGSLGALISANAVQSAPAGLKAAILTSAALTGAVATTGTIGAIKTVAMTTLQKTLISATLVAAVGTGLYEAQHASSLQTQMQALQRQSAAALAQTDPLRKQLDEADRRLKALQSENETLRKDAADIVRLRAEVARLRNAPTLSNSDSTATTAQSWLARVNQLKERLEQSPDAKIPEFQFLTEKDWLNAAMRDLKTEKDYLHAMSGLRSAAESTFVDTALKPALSEYQKANQGAFPTNFSQLQSYFNPPVDEAILQRWQVAPRTACPSLGMGGDTIITQVGPVDNIYDNRFGIGPGGSSGSAGPQDWDAPGTTPTTVLQPVFKAYFDANNGLYPDDVSKVASYIKTPEQQAALDLLLKRARR